MGQPISLKWGPNSSKGSLGLDGTQSCVNAFAKKTANGKSDYMMYAAPGLRPWATVPTGPHRGWISVQGRLLVAAGFTLYEVDALGVVTEVAGLPGSGFVQMAKNAKADPDVLMVASGRLWHWKGGAFVAFDSDFLPTLVGVVFIRGRFVVACSDGRLYWTGINDTIIDALSFANAEALPDGLVAIRERRNELWLFGSDSVEIWSPTENAEDPFSPLGGGAQPYGCLAAPGAVAENAGHIFWIDDNRQVRRAEGLQGAEISPPWVVEAIEKVADPSTIRAATFAHSGMNWYQISSPLWTMTYCLDSNYWTERVTGDDKRWRGEDSITFAGKTLIGDWQSGAIWELDANGYDDGEDHKPVVMVLRSALVHAFPTPLSVYSLHADIIAAAQHSANPEVSAPKAMLRISSDGGKSWSRPLYKAVGKPGARVSPRAIWRQLGTYERQGVSFELSMSARVARAVGDGIINGAAGSA